MSEQTRFERLRHEPAPQEPSADTVQAVRDLYRDDRDAMADAIVRLRADLAARCSSEEVP